MSDSISYWNITQSCVARFSDIVINFINTYFTLIKPSKFQDHIFSFAEFASALAIFIILYSTTDVRYRFRISIIRVDLIKISFWLFLITGFGLLSTNYWFAEGWSVPVIMSDPFSWQVFFSLTFFIPVLLWIRYAFIAPPIFNEKNSKLFCEKTYQIILRGLEAELPIIAHEMIRSAASIIKLTNCLPKIFTNENKQKNNKITHGDYAYHLLLLIGNRKFCRHIASSTPGTAAVFFLKMTELKKYKLPIHQFAVNIFTELLINGDSILYHEDSGYNDGLLGYQKPFRTDMFSDYALIETLAEKRSPFDISYELYNKWNATQLETYCNCFLIFAGSYLNKISQEGRMMHSYAFVRGLNIIKKSCDDLYTIKNTYDSYSTGPEERLRVCVNFVSDLLNILAKQRNLPKTTLRKRPQTSYDLYDFISNLMLEIIFSASSITEPFDRCWSIQYVMVFSHFFDPFRSKAEDAVKTVIHRLRRLLFNNIREFEEYPNYKSARILGYCMNVMGISLEKKNKNNTNQSYYALLKAVSSWAKNNYLKIYNYNPEIADACLMGGVIFDAKNNRLIKTYAKNLDGKAHKEYLYLNNDAEN